MSSLKITKKHHRHLNNPFPSAPKSLPFVQGTLFSESLTLATHQTFPIGKDFRLTWQSRNGGFLSVSHRLQPDKSLWSTIPGQAFVSGALAETEIQESRGSFVIKDREVRLVCDHQTIEDIRVIDHLDSFLHATDPDFPSGCVGFDQNDVKKTEFPVLMITGRIFSMKKKRPQDSSLSKKMTLGKDCTYARYWVFFGQKSSHQVGFQVRLGKPNFNLSQAISPAGLRRRQVLRLKLCQLRKKKLGWWWSFRRPRNYVAVSSAEDEIVGVKPPESTEFNRICLTYSSEKSEKFYGFGEQFSHMNFKGRRVPIFVQEQGIGRGDQPITFAANLVSHRAGGDWSTTYAPSPFYMTSKMRSLYLEGYNYSIFDLTRHDRVQIQMHNNSIEGSLVHGNSPTELLEHFTGTIGRPPELPEWIISGAVIGMQGGTDMVRHVWDELRAYNVPISAFWLQDWVGHRETFIGSQLWWNWEVDSTRYWGWRQLIKDLDAQHIRVMTYCNPCLAPAEENPNRRKNMFEEAKRLGILVRDKTGEPYMVPNTAFDVGMLDLTHPDTESWFKQILQDMVDDGIRGWMADFGEGLPVDAKLYSGEDPIVAHNRYPELWAKINRQFVDEWKSNHGEAEDPEDTLVFFMRAGFRESPKWGMLFWEGDQMVSWQVNDGIKSTVVGLLSSGLSGYAFNHSDIGGYCAVSLPLIRYHRSEELLLRWMELNAFTTIFRTHEGNKPSCNSQFYSNHKTFSHFARFAKVYSAWKFYRIQLIKEAAQKGLPVCRHLFLHYPEDDNVHKFTYQQFLVGTEILVVPVLDKGKNNVKAYFPVGESCPWQHIWTGKLYTNQGYEAWVESPIGQPAVFVKAGSLVGETFLKNLKDLNIL
ncbi:sulfoquinovosidase [Eucalyptus grandis]|uniref:sulfoquinovosidase n=1 Tax=Eucalyptus grandis TaxID=71139 RepID=UPI00192E8D22|nr:sulfoquinovosidase [Eucalyptus grandis]